MRGGHHNLYIKNLYDIEKNLCKFSVSGDVVKGYNRCSSAKSFP